MSWLDRFRKDPDFAKRENPFAADGELARALRAHNRRRRRGYEMAEDDRLASKWRTSTVSADGVIRYALAPLRARARELEENDPYIGRYFQLLEQNVVGFDGIKLVPEPPSTRNGKKIDRFAAERISAAFAEWSKRGTATVCGRYSLLDLQKRILRSTATDGELFLRIVVGPQAGNRFEFALEVIESELLDEQYNEELRNGNSIRMGVELNSVRRPVAYHFLTSNPGDYGFAGARGEVKRIRVPADRVIHCADWASMRPGQTRAVTWLANVGPSLYQLHGYRKAEAVAARVGSEKMGFYKRTAGDGDFDGDHSSVNESEFLQDSEPGAWEILPDGYEVEKFDPDHPSTAFDAFNKSMTRTAAAGLGVGYNALASDLESVSYSSMRSGTLEDRSYYRALQKWIVSDCGFEDRIFPEWIDSALLSGALRLTLNDAPRLKRHRWQSRGWQWVDPAKEGAGNKLGLELGTKLVGEVVAETSGRTIDEHLDALSKEIEKFEAAGLVHPSLVDTSSSSALAPPAPEPPEDDDE